MNIKPSNPLNRALSAYGSTAKAQAEPKNNASASSMSVSLSSGSQSLTDVDNDVNLEKVQAIRTALANGTLKINPERIAQGLLDQASELLKR